MIRRVIYSTEYNTEKSGGGRRRGSSSFLLQSPRFDPIPHRRLLSLRHPTTYTLLTYTPLAILRVIVHDDTESHDDSEKEEKDAPVNPAEREESSILSA